MLERYYGVVFVSIYKCFSFSLYWF